VAVASAGNIQVCTSLQTDNHANTHHSGRMPFLPPNQQRQSTEGENKYLNIEDKQKNLDIMGGTL